MKNLNILIVDDEKNIRRSMEMILRGEGYQTRASENIKAAKEEILKESPDLIFLDVMLPDGDGLSLLGEIKRKYPHIEIIIISGHATINLAVEATRSGAYDFLEKPLHKDKILITVQHLLEKIVLKEKFRQLEDAHLSQYKMIGNSPAISHIKEQITLASPTNSKILITGESGTGKELIAWAIHHQSNRKNMPFIKMNCAAIPENLIESELFGHEKGAFTGATGAKDGKFLNAHTGTLFLDEVADMSLNTQTKVLRALQEGQFERVGGSKTITVDVRVIAATNKNLEELIAKGEFREDLFYRLNVFPIENPPLRERLDDIPLLVSNFISEYCHYNNRKKLQIDDDVLKILQKYSWPGNIRELKNIVERMIILSPADTILKAVIPSHILKAKEIVSKDFPREMSLKEYREKAEKDYIQHCLNECGGNVSKAAGMLGIERTNLHKKKKALGI